MRVGLISDTHGLLRPEALDFLAGSDHIVHGGDIGGPEILERLAAIAPLTVVRGNNDTAPWARAIPATARVDFGGVALYAITLWGTYIYDDVLIADLDPRLHHIGRWVEFLTSPYAKGAPDRLFRPLTSLSFAVEWFLHGDRPWVMHLVNILLYGGVCAGVAVLARRES